MFNVGGGELLVILLIALMVLGPDRLPGFARKAGKVMGDVRRISQGFQSEIRDAMDFHDDTPSKPASGAASSATPRLVEPPKPAPPAIAPATDTAPDQTMPDHNGDEPASGTSAA
jgi:sec-independent protein translocase protein TatB